MLKFPSIDDDGVDADAVLIDYTQLVKCYENGMFIVLWVYYYFFRDLNKKYSRR